MTRGPRPRLTIMKSVTASRPATRVGEQRPKIRGRPFQPGNPGRPPGSKNRVTRMLEQLVAGEAEELSQKMIALAMQGNVPCLEFFLERLLPKRRGRPLDLQLPSINGTHDLMRAMTAVAAAVNDGAVTAEEVADLVHMFDVYANIITIHDLNVRLEALESEAKKRRDGDWKK
jgi:hypothetical protein